MLYKEELIKAAQEARKNAYVPYSKFAVGAALLGNNNKIYTGCNVENASYGLTICAERAAIFKAVSEGVTSFKALAIVTDLEVPASPCGACRQVIGEFSPDLEIIMANMKGNVHTVNLAELLPLSFSLHKNDKDN